MKSLIFITALVMLSACQHHIKREHPAVKGKFITKPTAVVVNPSDRLIAKYKKQYAEEDYNTIIDDDVYYLSQSEHYLDSVKIHKIEHTSEGSVKFKTPAGSVYEMKLDTIFFGVILFNGKDKPISADIVGIASDYDRYMKK